MRRAWRLCPATCRGQLRAPLRRRAVRVSFTLKHPQHATVNTDIVVFGVVAVAVQAGAQAACTWGGMMRMQFTPSQSRGPCRFSFPCVPYAHVRNLHAHVYMGVVVQRGCVQDCRVELLWLAALCVASGFSGPCRTCNRRDLPGDSRDLLPHTARSHATVAVSSRQGALLQCAYYILSTISLLSFANCFSSGFE